MDVVIIDTAGRLHIDDDMMAEIKRIHAAIMPIETLFVVDSMTGQDAANTAKAFNDTLDLTGVILTTKPRRYSRWCNIIHQAYHRQTHQVYWCG